MTTPDPTQAEREAAVEPRTDAIRELAQEYAQGHTVPDLEAIAAESFMCGYTDGFDAARAAGHAEGEEELRGLVERHKTCSFSVVGCDLIHDLRALLTKASERSD